MTRVGLVSLGCPKNRVDSEVLLGSLAGAGFEITADPAEAEVVVCNTCAFLAEARREAEEEIRRLARYKKRSCRLLVATGCLVKYLADRGRGEVAGADLLVGFSDYRRLPLLIRRRLGEAEGEPAAPASSRIVSTPPPFAYLRIAEGCDNRCRYCLIPSLRGRLASRPPGDILAEARSLAERGVRELILIAQDTAAYGRDRGEEGGLERLLDSLEGVDGIRWLRLLYAHPGHLAAGVLERMASSARLLPYLDIPFQHADTSILKRMGRGLTRESQVRLVERCRETVPGIVLRTTLMTGFPGEGEKEFAGLMEFVEWARFDHLGVFAYSPEPGTAAYRDRPRVPPETAARRREKIMLRQREISAEVLAGYRGKTIAAVGVDPETAEGGANARAWFQAPEIDGGVILEGRRPPPGEFCWVEIDDSSDYDLFGRVAGEVRTESAPEAGE
ncbi:MAG TPA: 30S ribosomal protein S12 methylthiotransferase RimO [bacterium]|nr:30S ribosomal protein S12 methylthiotransferase RimO [bacterium]HPJ72251.1 30S ribosomal protein S12 methylthiotransferase RimO [bacterium]HPQ65820.1 30S ribosomal protein S12 methylthiotransferase RimO [bacterium]